MVLGVKLLFLAPLLLFCIYGIQSEILEPCNCYMLGTTESVDGESICRQTKCKCHKNVVGQNCSRCRDSYYGILSGKGCQKCNCDEGGSVSSQCDPIEGRCHCKTNFDGFLCNKCKPDYYRTSNVTCEYCNCNIIGSKSLQCDHNGQCPCRENYTGQKCDACLKPTQKFSNGCTDCQGCYEIIENLVGDFEIKLNDIQNEIDKAITGNEEMEAIKNLEKYIDASKTLKRLLSLLKNKVYSINLDKEMNQIESTNKTLVKVEKRLAELSQIKPNSANQIMKSLNSTIVEINSQLRLWEFTINKAVNISSTVIQSNKNLLNIKNEAVKISKSMEEAYKNLKNTFHTIESSCDNAVQLMNNVGEHQEALKMDISSLKSDITSYNDKFSELNLKVKEVSEIATKSIENSKYLLEKAKSLPNNIAVPNIIVTEERITKANQKLVKYKENNAEFLREIEDLKKTLNGSYSVRNQIEMELMDYENFMTTCDSIIKNIDDLIREKQNTLKDFNKNLTKQQNLAMLKLKTATLVRTNIKNLSEKLRIAEQDLQKNANEKISGAKDINKLLEKNLSTINETVNELNDDFKKLVLDLKEKLSTNTEKMLTIEEALKEVNLRLNEADDQNKEILDLKKSLEESRMLASNLDLVPLKDETRRIKEVINFIKELPLSKPQLNRIESELKKARKNLKKYNDQREALLHYKNMADEYKALEKEVDKVKSIAESLKKIDNQCFLSRPIEASPDV